MSLFKDASQTLMKYGELLVNKTEEYTKIAKLNLDIKKIETSIDKIHAAAGFYIIDRFEKNESFNQDDPELKEKFNEVISLKSDIDTIKKDIEVLKQEAKQKQEQSKNKYENKNEEAKQNESANPDVDNHTKPEEKITPQDSQGNDDSEHKA